ncbi:pyridoxamine 5'-phosphate oxidase family protein [Kitasatospora sp. NPDC004289]
MTSRYAQIAFTTETKRHQQAHGSARSYERMAAGAKGADQLGPDEAWFIQERDSFYLASASATGWPYVQHRGGPKGFVKVLDERHIAFADYRGNKQYITTGNLDHDSRVSLFLVDYPHRARLKVYGRARAVDVNEDRALIEAVRDKEYSGVPERVMVIEVEAFDWNCSQHITPRFTKEEIETAVEPLTTRLEELERENARLKAQLLGTA